MIWKLLSKQCKTQMLHYLQAMQMPFFLIQCPIDTSLDISRGVVYKKLPQKSASAIYGYDSRNCLYPSRFSTSNAHVKENFLLSRIIRILLHYLLEKCKFFDPFTNNSETCLLYQRHSKRSTIYMLSQQLN